MHYYFHCIIKYQEFLRGGRGKIPRRQVKEIFKIPRRQVKEIFKISRRQVKEIFKIPRRQVKEIFYVMSKGENLFTLEL